MVGLLFVMLFVYLRPIILHTGTWKKATKK